MKGKKIRKLICCYSCGSAKMVKCKDNSSKRGYCPKCGKLKRLTRHHCLPKRFFRGSGPILMICRSCHDDLELLIPFKPKLAPKEYYEIIDRFLGSTDWRKTALV